MSTSTTRYDRFGRPAGYINPIAGAPEPYLIKTASDTVSYVCYYETGTDPRAIRRISKSGTQTQVAVTWGDWADPASNDFYPVNSIFTVDDETKALVSVSPYDTPVAALS